MRKVHFQERPALKSLNFLELQSHLSVMGVSASLALQIFHSLYRHLQPESVCLQEVGKPSRVILAGGFQSVSLKIIQRVKSTDSSEKFLFQLEDGLKIETVFMPSHKGGHTLCLSSQAGCSLACVFCATGRMGFQRNLKTEEIVEQVVSVQRAVLPRRVQRLVFMGMGEPLMNYEQVKKAVEILRADAGFNFSARNITISTAGVIPGIQQMNKDMPELNLAVSINAPHQALRESLMPIAKKYPLDALVECLRRYPLPHGGRLLLEYVLLGQVNDSVQDAIELCRVVAGIKAKINLIPFNHCPGLSYRRPDFSRIRAFAQTVREHGFPAYIRQSRGQDIYGACGQLGGGTAPRCMLLQEDKPPL